MIKPISLAVLISGAGSTLKNLWTRREQIPAEISLVLASKKDTLGSQWAKEQKLPLQEIPRNKFTTTEAFSNAITSALEPVQPDLIILAGFIHRYLIPQQYHLKVMNIHPSLIPAFSGKGFYGERVHQAVLERGVWFSGCTVHFADNEYDHGPIILQKIVEVRSSDTVQTLANRVFEAEQEAYPQAIQWYHQKKLKIDGNKVILCQ